MTGKTDNAPHELLYWHLAAALKRSPELLRDGDYKLILKRGKPELYDLKNDLSESTDISQEQLKWTKRMLAQWKT